MSPLQVAFTESNARVELRVQRRSAVLYLLHTDSNGVEIWTHAELNRRDLEQLCQTLHRALSLLPLPERGATLAEPLARRPVCAGEESAAHT